MSCQILDMSFVSLSSPHRLWSCVGTIHLSARDAVALKNTVSANFNEQYTNNVPVKYHKRSHIVHILLHKQMWSIFVCSDVVARSCSIVTHVCVVAATLGGLFLPHGWHFRYASQQPLGSSATPKLHLSEPVTGEWVGGIVSWRRCKTSDWIKVIFYT